MRLFVIAIILFSCSTPANHSHDGTYSMKQFGQELGFIKINGDEITMKIDGSLMMGEGNFEVRTKCKQFDDRIEFEQDGSALVGRFTKEGNLDLMGYVFDKVGGDGRKEKMAIKPKPAPKKTAPNQVSLVLSSSHEEKQPDHEPTHVSEINYGFDEKGKYEYIESVRYDENEKFFNGAKIFAGYIDDVYRVQIEAEDIIITDTKRRNSILFQGTIKGGQILDLAGKEAPIVYISPRLYYRKKEGEWLVFHEYE